MAAIEQRIVGHNFCRGRMRSRIGLAFSQEVEEGKIYFLLLQILLPCSVYLSLFSAISYQQVPLVISGAERLTLWARSLFPLLRKAICCSSLIPFLCHHLPSYSHESVS